MRSFDDLPAEAVAVDVTGRNCSRFVGVDRHRDVLRRLDDRFGPDGPVRPPAAEGREHVTGGRAVSSPDQ